LDARSAPAGRGPRNSRVCPDARYQNGKFRPHRGLHCSFFGKTLKYKIVARCATRYTVSVIKSFKHKGLRRYYETGNKSGIQAKHAARLRLQLAVLDTARVIDDIDVPGYRLHPLKGRENARWSIWISGNWRLTFEFRDGNAYVLDYEDYH